MNRRGYRPSTVQKQLNADRYDTAVTSADKYRKHIDPSFVDQDGRNGVHKAVLLALQESPFVDIPTDGVDNSPASVALDQAVRAGCDVNAVDRSGRRPIHYAADSGHVTCIRRLVRYGVDPNALTTPATSTGGVGGGGTGGKAIHGGGLSPLMLAARAGRIDAIRVLLKNGAKATLSNDRSETALHFAAASSEYTEECIGALAGQQAGTAGKHLVNVQDSDGSTALMIAARNKSSPAASAAVRLLIQLGADVTCADTQGRTALHWASLSNQPEVVRLLHTARADLDAVDSQGDTAYVSAIKANSPDALQSLIDVGCDSSMIDGLMGTAVALAAVKGHVDVIETLVRNGEDPDDFGYFGKTPMMLAAYESHSEAVGMLLKLGADPNISGRTGGTALIAALLRTNSSNEIARQEIVIQLIRAGVDVNQPSVAPTQSNTATNPFKTVCTSNSGWNLPLSHAIDTGYLSLVRILLIAGSVIPTDEVRRRQSSSARLFDTDELLAPVLEWSSQPVSLQQVCRSVIRNAILVGRHRCSTSRKHFSVEKAIASLPAADRLKRYLNFAELSQIPVQRARVVDGVGHGMMQMSETSPCGMRAIEGTIDQSHNTRIGNSS